ncbi:hypothetical protein BJ742DRAFT_873451 [Cladochytrium replicatum]|nr:hypothetical protein BJ742DRAFT_873451 [Cladochytrium replicatum]
MYSTDYDEDRLGATVDYAEDDIAALDPSGDDDAEEEDYVIRCICDFNDDDGYTIQCDRCEVWQHMNCLNMTEDSVPDSYLCERCEPRPISAEMIERARQIQGKRTRKKSREKDGEKDSKRDRGGGNDPQRKRAKDQRGAGAGNSGNSSKKRKDSLDRDEGSVFSSVRTGSKALKALKIGGNSSGVSPPRKRAKELEKIARGVKQSRNDKRERERVKSGAERNASAASTAQSARDRLNRDDSEYGDEDSSAARGRRRGPIASRGTPPPETGGPAWGSSNYQAQGYKKSLIPQPKRTREQKPINLFDEEYRRTAHAFAPIEHNKFESRALELAVGRLLKDWDDGTVLSSKYRAFRNDDGDLKGADLGKMVLYPGTGPVDSNVKWYETTDELVRDSLGLLESELGVPSPSTRRMSLDLSPAKNLKPVDVKLDLVDEKPIDFPKIDPTSSSKSSKELPIDFTVGVIPNDILALPAVAFEYADGLVAIDPVTVDSTPFGLEPEYGQQNGNSEIPKPNIAGVVKYAAYATTDIPANHLVGEIHGKLIIARELHGLGSGLPWNGSNGSKEPQPVSSRVRTNSASAQNHPVGISDQSYAADGMWLAPPFVFPHPGLAVVGDVAADILPPSRNRRKAELNAYQGDPMLEDRDPDEEEVKEASKPPPCIMVDSRDYGKRDCRFIRWYCGTDPAVAATCCNVTLKSVVVVPCMTEEDSSDEAETRDAETREDMVTAESPLSWFDDGVVRLGAENVEDDGGSRKRKRQSWGDGTSPNPKRVDDRKGDVAGREDESGMASYEEAIRDEDRVLYINDRIRLAVFATKDIAAGEELVLNAMSCGGDPFSPSDPASRWWMSYPCACDDLVNVPYARAIGDDEDELVMSSAAPNRRGTVASAAAASGASRSQLVRPSCRLVEAIAHWEEAAEMERIAREKERAEEKERAKAFERMKTETVQTASAMPPPPPHAPTRRRSVQNMLEYVVSSAPPAGERKRRESTQMDIDTVSSPLSISIDRTHPTRMASPTSADDLDVGNNEDADDDGAAADGAGTDEERTTTSGRGRGGRRKKGRATSPTAKRKGRRRSSIAPTVDAEGADGVEPDTDHMNLSDGAEKGDHRKGNQSHAVEEERKRSAAPPKEPHRMTREERKIAAEAALILRLEQQEKMRAKAGSARERKTSADGGLATGTPAKRKVGRPPAQRRQRAGSSHDEDVHSGGEEHQGHKSSRRGSGGRRRSSAANERDDEVEDADVEDSFEHGRDESMAEVEARRQSLVSETGDVGITKVKRAYRRSGVFHSSEDEEELEEESGTIVSKVVPISSSPKDVSMEQAFSQPEDEEEEVEGGVVVSNQVGRPVPDGPESTEAKVVQEPVENPALKKVTEAAPVRKLSLHAFLMMKQPARSGEADAGEGSSNHLSASQLSTSTPMDIAPEPQKNAVESNVVTIEERTMTDCSPSAQSKKLDLGERYRALLERRAAESSTTGDLTTPISEEPFVNDDDNPEKSKPVQDAAAEDYFPVFPKSTIADIFYTNVPAKQDSPPSPSAPRWSMSLKDGASSRSSKSPMRDIETRDDPVKPQRPDDVEGARPYNMPPVQASNRSSIDGIRRGEWEPLEHGTGPAYRPPVQPPTWDRGMLGPPDARDREMYRRTPQPGGDHEMGMMHGAPRPGPGSYSYRGPGAYPYRAGMLGSPPPVPPPGNVRDRERDWPPHMQIPPEHHSRDHPMPKRERERGPPSHPPFNRDYFPPGPMGSHPHMGYRNREYMEWERERDAFRGRERPDHREREREREYPRKERDREADGPPPVGVTPVPRDFNKTREFRDEFRDRERERDRGGRYAGPAGAPSGAFPPVGSPVPPTGESQAPKDRSSMRSGERERDGPGQLATRTGVDRDPPIRQHGVSTRDAPSLVTGPGALSDAIGPASSSSVSSGVLPYAKDLDEPSTPLPLVKSPAKKAEVAPVDFDRSTFGAGRARTRSSITDLDRERDWSYRPGFARDVRGEFEGQGREPFRDRERFNVRRNLGGRPDGWFEPLSPRDGQKEDEPHIQRDDGRGAMKEMGDTDARNRSPGTVPYDQDKEKFPTREPPQLQMRESFGSDSGTPNRARDYRNPERDRPGVPFGGFGRDERERDRPEWARERFDRDRMGRMGGPPREFRDYGPREPLPRGERNWWPERPIPERERGPMFGDRFSTDRGGDRVPFDRMAEKERGPVERNGPERINDRVGEERGLPTDRIDRTGQMIDRRLDRGERAVDRTQLDRPDRPERSDRPGLAERGAERPPERSMGERISERMDRFADRERPPQRSIVAAERGGAIRPRLERSLDRMTDRDRLDRGRLGLSLDRGQADRGGSQPPFGFARERPPAGPLDVYTADPVDSRDLSGWSRDAAKDAQASESALANRNAAMAQREPVEPGSSAGSSGRPLGESNGDKSQRGRSPPPLWRGGSNAPFAGGNSSTPPPPGWERQARIRSPIRPTGPYPPGVGSRSGATMLPRRRAISRSPPPAIRRPRRASRSPPPSFNSPNIGPMGGPPGPNRFGYSRDRREMDREGRDHRDGREQGGMQWAGEIPRSEAGLSRERDRERPVRDGYGTNVPREREESDDRGDRRAR